MFTHLPVQRSKWRYQCIFILSVARVSEYARTLLHYLLPGRTPILWATTTQVRFSTRKMIHSGKLVCAALWPQPSAIHLDVPHPHDCVYMAMAQTPSSRVKGVPHELGCALYARVANWKTRWFVLAEGHLSNYKQGGNSFITGKMTWRSCNGVTLMVVITRYIGVVHTVRDQCHW